MTQRPVVSVDAADRVLGTTLAATYDVGSNLHGAETENWRYLLPSVAPRRVACLGTVRPSVVASLARIAEHVIVYPHSSRYRDRIVAATRGYTFGTIEIRDAVPWALPDVDLVYLAGRRASRLVVHRSGGIRTRVPTPPGTTVFAEWRELVGRRAAGLDKPILWLGPASGGVHAAAPLADIDAVGHLESRGLARTPGGGRLARRALRRMLDRPVLTRHVHRRGMLLTGEPSSPDGLPPLPAYVRRLAADHGVDLAPRWAMSAPGPHRSKKVVFLTFDDLGQLTDVVKVVRDPDLNHRLDNEARALDRLACLGMRGDVPVLRFAGTHADRAVVCQRAISGRPLTPRIDEDHDWQVVAMATLLDRLARASRQPESGAVVADALTTVVDHYVRLYAPDRDQHRLIVEQVERVRQAEVVPVVFQHGDPGPWNGLVRDDGSAALLDWEAAERYGMPTWDLLMFFHGYATNAGAAAGIRDPLVAATRLLLEPSRLGGRMAALLGAHSRDLELDSELAEPLFHLCWVHRAVKEATRLSAGRLRHARYARLVARSLAGQGEHPPALLSWVTRVDR